MKRLIVPMLFVAGTLLLGGCGQKGPLYLPPRTPHRHLPAEATKVPPARAIPGAGAGTPHA